jgi:dTDP-4-dehydrorhamnose 3,5-epimerase
MGVSITELEIPCVKLIEPDYFEDYRGYYSETYSSRSLREYGIEAVFVQDNHSFSIKSGTLRGIHFQNNPKSQLKLVRCVRGKIMDFAVDLRKGSSTYKKYLKAELSADNRRQILIPHGFGHAFLTLEDGCEVLYKVDEWYYPEFDRAVAFDDPDIGIDWGLNDPIISAKDRSAPKLKDSDVNFVLQEGR